MNSNLFDEVVVNAGLSANLRQRKYERKVIHIKRELVGTGKVTARKGEEVTPTDVLGRFQSGPDYSSLNLAKSLGCETKDAPQYLHRPIGSKIFKGELLAFRRGLVGIGDRTIVAPVDCVLDSYNQITGDLRIKLFPKETPLLAGVYGVIDQIDEKNSVMLIRTMVTEIYGAFGTGKPRFGPVHVMGTKDTVMTKEQITGGMTGRIVVTGALIYSDALKKAISYGVSGIISGGLYARDYKSMGSKIDQSLKVWTDVGISVLATEGFGAMPIGDDIFQDLISHEGKLAFIHGNGAKLLLPINDPDCIITIRKTYLPVSTVPDSLPEVKLEGLHPGQSVRLIWPPHPGIQGRILAIDQQPTTLPSGLITYLLTVETRMQKIKVPYTNVELIA